MAVQAQYPSNVLLRNRNVQEGKAHLGNEYSLRQQQQQGTFLDHPSHMLFNNIAGNNPRKRAREVDNMSSQLPVNLCKSSQRQQQEEYQFLNLSELHNQPLNVVSTGLQLAFNDHRQQQLLFEKQNHPHSVIPHPSVALSMLTEDLSSEIKRQRDEIEHFVHAQEEELRRTLAAKWQKHYYTLLGLAEGSLARRIRDKEEDMQKSLQKNMELEAQAAQFITEAQVWQARAKAQEATAETLQAQLQHAILSRGCRDNKDGNGVLGCTAGEVAEDAESACNDPDRLEAVNGPGCKSCGKRIATVVLLPCRHLCICAECEGVVQACPVCFSFRSSSIQVLLA